MAVAEAGLAAEAPRPPAMTTEPGPDGAPSGDTVPVAPLSPAPPPRPRSVLLLLILGQVALHAAMAGQRMAAPLQALSQGESAWRVGVLLALFAALPVVTAMASGRMADRHGYHRPLRVAVAATMAGAACALLACALSGWGQFGLLCLGAAVSGVGANVGLIAVQRTAGHLTQDATERLRVFSWLGMAPSLANVVGPVCAGFMIDGFGHAAAYALMMALPLVSLAAGRRVPREVARPTAMAGATRGQARDLVRLPGMKRLLFVNWLMSTSWDMHSFAVPVLAHARGYSASTVGLVLGTFTAAVTLVRFAIPLLAHRLSEVAVLTTAMLCSAVVLGLYPFAPTPWAMGLCAALLGLSLGAVQPMVMSTLYHLTPAHRHGEALAFRSMAINFSSSAMPLVFGAAGAALGPGVLFWVVAAAVGLGCAAVPGLQRVFQQGSTTP